MYDKIESGQIGLSPRRHPSPRSRDCKNCQCWNSYHAACCHSQEGQWQAQQGARDLYNLHKDQWPAHQGYHGQNHCWPKDLHQAACWWTLPKYLLDGQPWGEVQGFCVAKQPAHFQAHKGAERQGKETPATTQIEASIHREDFSWSSRWTSSINGGMALDHIDVGVKSYTASDGASCPHQWWQSNALVFFKKDEKCIQRLYYWIQRYHALPWLRDNRMEGNYVFH